MSQSIKFRAWYKPDFKTRDGPLKFIQETDEDSNLVFRMEADKDFEYDFNIPFSDKNWTVQQFTGLLDKNGVEIYDGDVVALYPIKFEQTKIGEGIYHLDTSKPLPSPDVIYARGIVGYDVDFCQYKIIYTWVCDAWKESGQVSTALVKNYYEYEVVGNVFVNPEFLMN